MFVINLTEAVTANCTIEPSFKVSQQKTETPEPVVIVEEKVDVVAEQEDTKTTTEPVAEQVEEKQINAEVEIEAEAVDKVATLETSEKSDEEKSEAELSLNPNIETVAIEEFDVKAIS